MKSLVSKQYAGQRKLLNPAHPYTSAAATNIAETFSRIRAQMQKPAKDEKVRRVK